MEDWSSKAILAQNRGCRLATYESWTGDCEATRSGPIGLAETRDNGYVVSDTLLKKNHIPAKMSECCLCNKSDVKLVFTQSEEPRLSNREINYFRSIPTYVITIPQRHGQTDDLLWQYRALRSIAR